MFLMKKILSILAVMLLSTLTLFASQSMNVSWQWDGGDDGIAFYRYQLDATAEDGWTVVDKSVTSFEATSLDPYVDHTLYVESSYDGVNWSDTASAMAEALLTAEEEVVVSEPVVEESVEVVTIPEEEVVPVEEPVEVVAVEEEEEVVVDLPTPVAPVEIGNPSRFAFSLLIRGGITSPVNMDRIGGVANSSVENEFVDPVIDLGISLDFANIITADEALGFGLRFDFDYVIDPTAQYGEGKEFFNPDLYYSNVTGTILLTMDARAGVANLQFGLGAGTTAFLNQTSGSTNTAYWDTPINEYNLSWNVFAEALVGVRFYMGDLFSLGIEGYYRMMIPNYENMDWGADIVLGFTF